MMLPCAWPNQVVKDHQNIYIYWSRSFIILHIILIHVGHKVALSMKQYQTLAHLVG